MLAIWLAMAAAFFWGISALFVRLGLRDMTTSLGTMISLVTGLFFTALVVAGFYRDDLMALSTTALLLFGAVGILNFPMGRYLNYLSVSHLGVGGSAPILASSPLFAMIGAVLFVGESVTLAILAGTLLILAGLVISVRRRPAVTHPGIGEAQGGAAIIGYIVALSAAAAYGASQVLTRHAVHDLAPPLVGSLVALTFGTVGFVPLTRPANAIVGNRPKGVLNFIGAGVSGTMGFSLSFLALERAEVVIVSPITNVSPIISLLLAAVFLRGIERLNAQLFIGAGLVVAGVIVLTVA